MIITQTPYRVSFAGGGTDLPAFYEHDYGAVLSVALQQHIYITVSPRFEDSTRIAYSQVEIQDQLEKINHTIAREALRMTNVGEHLEITTVGDVPAGTGMGSSSSLAVGLLNALSAYKGQITSPKMLAEQACKIEIDILGKPIGRQDQYAAAYGGVNYIKFNPDHSVEVEPVPCKSTFLDQLEQHTLLLYTDQQRDADIILQKQSKGSSEKLSVLCEMRDLAGEMRRVMGGGGDLDEFGRLLHEGWLLSDRWASGSPIREWMSGTSQPVQTAQSAASCWELAGVGFCWFLRRLKSMKLLE